MHLCASSCSFTVTGTCPHRTKMLPHIFLIILFCKTSAAACPAENQIDAYLLASIHSNQGSNAWKTFQCLLNQYQIKYNKTWLHTAVLHTDQSIEIDTSNFENNGGIGNPDSESSHEGTCFTLINMQGEQENLTLRFQNMEFVDVIIISRFVNLEFDACTFYDSTVNMSNASFLKLRHSTVKQQKRLTSIRTNDIDEISLTQCSFNGTIEGTDTHESSIVFFRNASIVRMEDVKFENITNVPGRHMVKIVNGECSLKKVTIQNNRDIAGIFLQDVNRCQVETSLFKNNTIAHGSTLVLNNSDVVVKFCNFSDSTSRTGTAIYANALKDKHLLHIENAIFKNNTAQRGGALYLARLYNITISHSHFLNNIATKMSTGNSARGSNEGSGGAIYIETSKRGPRTNINVQYSDFFGNFAKKLGGGLFIGCAKTFDLDFLPITGDENKNPPCNPDSGLFQLNVVNFTKNRGYFGGAFASYVTSDIQRSTFNSNTAYIGGALFLFQDKCNLTYVKFHDNDASYSGNSISARNSTLRIDHCTIQNNIENKSKMFGLVHQVSLHRSNTVITDFRVTLSSSGCDPETINVFESQIPNPYPDCTCPDDHNVKMKDLTLTCPWNYKAVPYLTEVNCTVGDVNDFCTFVSPFNFVCERLPEKMYFPRQDSYIVRNDPVGGNKLINKTLFDREYSCPVPGGNCTRELKAAPGYWCYEPEGKKKMVCVKCPPEICCNGRKTCLKFDSCAENREGTMCCKCIDGYIEPFFSKSCKRTCKNGVWILGVVPVVLVIALSVSVIFGVTDEVIKVFKLLSSAVKPFITSAKGHQSVHHSTIGKGTKVSTTTGRHHVTMTDAIEPEPLENDSNQTSTDSGQALVETSSSLTSNLEISTSLPYLMILTYMIQDFAVFHTSMYDCSPHKSPLRHLKLTIINAFHFHIDVLAKLSFFDDMCIYSFSGHPISALLKEFLKVSVYFISYIVFLTLYVLLCIWKSCQRCTRLNDYLKRVNIKLRLISGFLTMQFLIYQKLSSTGVKFVNCYEVKGKSVLHMDPSQFCNQGYWWVVSWLYLVVCIIPLPFFVMVGPSLLKRKVVNLLVFNVSLVVPLFSPLLSLILYVTRRMSGGMSETPQRQENSAAQESCSSPPVYQVLYAMENETDSERTPLVHVKKLKTSNNSKNISSTSVASNQQTAKDKDPKKAQCEKNQKKEEPETDENTSLSGIVVANLQGYFRSVGCGINWLGVVLAFRLSLVFCSLLIPLPDLCSFVLLLICLVRCCVGLKVQPYNDKYLNWFSSGSLFCILLVSVCDFGMALLQRIQYEDCASDGWIRSFAYIIDTFTIYIPSLCLFLLALYIAVCFMIKCCRLIKNIANKIQSFCHRRKKQR